MQQLGRSFPNEFPQPEYISPYGMLLDETSQAFTTSGFKMLQLGSRLQDLPIQYEIVDDDNVSGIKRVEFAKGNWLCLGSLSFTSFSAEFFHDKMFRIRIRFDDSAHKGIFEMLQLRFGEFQNDGHIWIRGGSELSAISPVRVSGRSFPVLLAPSMNKESEFSFVRWDEVDLLDNEQWKEVERLTGGKVTLLPAPK